MKVLCRSSPYGTAELAPFTLLQPPLTLAQSPLTVLQARLTLAQRPLTLLQSPFTVAQSRLTSLQIPLTPVQSPLTLTQTAGVAGPFETCFSVMSRWDGGAGISLTVSDGTTTQTRAFRAGSWSRDHIAMRGGASSASRTAGIVVPAQTQVIMAAPQLEIASQPNAYVETGAQSGVFASAWLAQKQFDLKSPAPGAHSTTLHIESLRQS